MLIFGNSNFSRMRILLSLFCGNEPKISCSYCNDFSILKSQRQVQWEQYYVCILCWRASWGFFRIAIAWAYTDFNRFEFALFPGRSLKDSVPALKHELQSPKLHAIAIKFLHLYYTWKSHQKLSPGRTGELLILGGTKSLTMRTAYNCNRVLGGHCV